MAEELTPAPGFSLRVLSRTEEQLVMDASYAGGGSAPPAHFHPAQDERFEVLDGTVARQSRRRGDRSDAGGVLELPRRTAHQLWNRGREPAVLRWVTAPAGRRLEFFRELAAVAAGAGKKDRATLLERYSDVFRLAAGRVDRADR